MYDGERTVGSYRVRGWMDPRTCLDVVAMRNFSTNTNYSNTFIIIVCHFQVKPYNISVTLCLPPDTDTPGFATEEKTKPMETRLISQSAGLVSPEAVAKQLMEDTLVSYFRKDVVLLHQMCIV
jgi:hypothetical protein